MVTYTSSATYWSPLRPRIRIYTFSDTTYASPLYTYNAFTDVGTETKPIALSFDSNTTSVGNFAIEIEDSTSLLDPDIYLRGNRVFIECSKDGSTWQPAFKGLVRSVEQKLYATSGKNILLEGYSYLIRLNERVLDTIKESSLIVGGGEYDRTDTTMHTNNLVNDLLTTDANYIYGIVDDTQLYNVFKTSNITSSPIIDWIPRLDAQLVTVATALNRILDFSNGVIILNPANDELMMYTSDLVTSETGIFLITNQSNNNADDADITMYPLEPYSYNISYDYPDSGSRLISSLGSAGKCFEPVPIPVGTRKGYLEFFISTEWPQGLWYAPLVMFENTPLRNLYIITQFYGDHSAEDSMEARLFHEIIGDGSGTLGAPEGAAFDLYVDGVEGSPLPNTSGWETFILAMPKDVAGPVMVPYQWYFLSVHSKQNLAFSKNIRWYNEGPSGTGHLPGRYAESVNSGSSWLYHNLLPGESDTNGQYHKWAYGVTGDPCGANQSTIETDNVFAIAHDKNMSNRMGIVERIVSGLPTHIKNKQTLDEYLYNQIYFSAKPRFTFDYPSLTMSNKLPKAGDIVAHVDSRVNVGINNAPVQTGLISSVRYSFAQGSGQNDALGLRKLALKTTGIKRGSY